MGKKEEFLEVLNHPEVLKLTKAQVQLYERNVASFELFYKNVQPEKRFEWAVSASSYLFGKALEINILSNIRPEDKSVWLVPNEVEEGITFDLPKHLEDDVIDVMDPFESACEELFRNNLNFNFHNFWIMCEAFVLVYAQTNKMWEHTVGGVENAKVLTKNELYQFGIQAFKQEMEKHGFKLEKATSNLIEPVNALLSKDGVNYFVSLAVSILPREGYIADWRLNKLKDEANKAKAVPVVTYIGLLPEDELLASEGIAIKEGQYKIQIKKLVNVLNGEIVE
jgi:hypothetical protein